MKKLMHLLMLSCLQATKLIEKQFIAKLSWVQKFQLRLHTSACNACSNYQKQSRIIHSTLLEQARNGIPGNGSSIDPVEIANLKQEIILHLEEGK